MPRRVFRVSASDVRLNGLDDPARLREFLAPRTPDIDDWDVSLRGDYVVLDHRDPERPLTAIGHHRPGGKNASLVHVARPKCVAAGCSEEAIHGTPHCPAHLE